MGKMHPKEMERRLGMQYAQLLKDTPQNTTVHRECQEVIEASLNIMEHYNRISLAIKNRLPNKNNAGVFS
jgi:hypothetical protein